MKQSKLLLLLFGVLSLPFLITSCSKDSNSAEPPPPAPSIIGNWNLVSQTETLPFDSQIRDTTYTVSTDFYGNINFQPDQTVYNTKSILTGVTVYGTTLYFTGTLNPLKADTAEYTINNNVISYTGSKYNSPYKDTILLLTHDKLVLTNLVPYIYKKTYYYSKIN